MSVAVGTRIRDLWGLVVFLLVLGGAGLMGACIGYNIGYSDGNRDGLRGIKPAPPSAIDFEQDRYETGRP